MIDFHWRASMTKVCTKCLIDKPITEYYASKGTVSSACKPCVRISGKQYRIKTGKIKGNYGKSRFEALLGKTINDWHIVGSEIVRGKRSTVLCRCKCGKEQLVICDRLESGDAKGCRECYPVNGSHSPLFQGVGEISLTYLRKIVEQANDRNIEVSVSASDLWELYLKQKKKCALTGLDIHFGKHTHNKQTKVQSQTASLDRINSSKGYVIENLQWVHKHVNIMKNRYDQEYFKQMCKLVTENAN